jgi:hypothetical protein
MEHLPGIIMIMRGWSQDLTKEELRELSPATMFAHHEFGEEMVKGNTKHTFTTFYKELSGYSRVMGFCHLAML